MILIISTLLVISLFFSFCFTKISKPALLGYILTGVILGPYLSKEYSEIIYNLGHFGLLMLIFEIGIEFDLKKFKENYVISSLIFFIQLIISFSFSYLICYFYKIDFLICLLVTFLLVLSSTAVVIKLLDAMNKLYTRTGGIIISILILQDLAIVPITIILSQAKNASIKVISSKVFISIFILYVLICYLSSSFDRVCSPLKVIFDGNQEMMTLALMTFCFAFAALSEYAGLSASYGPFLAGLMLGSVGSKHDMLDFIKPIGSILLMIFFIYVGSKVNLVYLKENIILIIVLTFVLLIAKILINYIALLLVGYSKRKSFLISTILSQASEFSFSFVAILTNISKLSIAQANLINTLCIISLTLGSIVPLFASAISKYIFSEPIDE